MKLALLALAFASSVQAQSAPAFESLAGAQFDALALASGPVFQRNPAATLFDQGPIFTQTGTPNNLSILQTAAPVAYCTLGSSGAGTFRLSDDFTVPTGQTWLVDRVVVFGYQTGATAPSITAGTLRILSTSPGLSATPTVVFGDTTTNRVTPANVTLSGTVRVTDTTLTAVNRLMQAIPLTISPAVPLTAGTYWIDFQATGSVASGPFFPPLTTAILAAQAPTGNAFQLTTVGSAYVGLIQALPNPTCDPTTTTPGPAQGLPFIVEGTNAAPVPVAVTPSGTSLSFTVGSGAIATRTLSFTGAGSVACTATGPFTVAPNPLVAPGSVTVTATAAGTGTLTCVSGATTVATYPLTATSLVAVSALNVWGAFGLLLALSAFGVIAVRRFS
jgi:hypothetical protein